MRPFSLAASAAAFFVPLGIYIFSMQRNVGFWDVGEMQTVPYILGIAHPTGFPAFTIFGWLFTHLFVIGSVAWRMTLFCALAMSGAALIIYYLVCDETGEPWLAVLCAWCFAFTDVAWVRGTRTEVHALSALFIAGTIYCALRWSRDEDVRWLYAGALAWALGIATHPVAALLVFGLLMIVLCRWDTLSVRALWTALAMCMLVTLLFYAYLPLRSAQVYAQRRDPTLALGVEPGRPFWDYHHPASREGFMQLVSGSDFPVGDGLAAVLLPQTYSSQGSVYGNLLVWNFTWPGVVLLIAGAFVFVRRERLRGAGLIVAGFFGVPFALGFREEADIVRYFLPSFLAAAFLVGIAVNGLLKGFPRMRGAILGTFGLMVAVQFVQHDGLLGQRTDPGATHYLAFVRAHTEPNAILMAPWTYATPLAYAAYVEQSLDQRTVETAWLSDDIDELPRWVKTRPVYIVYLPWGDMPSGYRLERLPGGDPPLYRVLQKRK